MVEVLRWLGLVISGFSVCCSSYALWLSLTTNRRLIRQKRELMMENAMLSALCETYERKLDGLREGVPYEGQDND